MEFWSWNKKLVLIYFCKIKSAKWRIRVFHVYALLRVQLLHVCSAILNFSCIFHRFTIIFLYLSKIDKFAPGNPLRFFIRRIERYIQRLIRTHNFFLIFSVYLTRHLIISRIIIMIIKKSGEEFSSVRSTTNSIVLWNSRRMNSSRCRINSLYPALKGAWQDNGGV